MFELAGSALGLGFPLSRLCLKCTTDHRRWMVGLLGSHSRLTQLLATSLPLALFLQLSRMLTNTTSPTGFPGNAELSGKQKVIVA